jgi:gluconate 2-dehydrogenase gamma chain
MAGDLPRVFSRRDLLKGIGVVGAAAVAQTRALNPAAAPTPPVAAAQAAAGIAAREPLETLLAVEADALEAIVARIIPTDENGLGAREARASHYIDRGLGGALADSLGAYRAGLAAIDRYARSSHGKLFAELSPADQDSVLIAVEGGNAIGFAGSGAFFDMVRTHTIQGTFCDPYYGGNANFVGWDLIGYPGVRTIVTADDQRMSKMPPPTHKSAYDFPMFTKASARLGSRKEGSDAD